MSADVKSCYKNNKSLLNFLAGLVLAILSLKLFMYYDNEIREINGHGYATLSSIVSDVNPRSEIILEIKNLLVDGKITPVEFNKLVNFYSRQHGGLEMPAITVRIDIEQQYPRDVEKEKLLEYLDRL